MVRRRSAYPLERVIFGEPKIACWAGLVGGSHKDIDLDIGKITDSIVANAAIVNTAVAKRSEPHPLGITL